MVCAPIMGRDLSPIREIDPSIELIDGNAAFESYNQARIENDGRRIDSTARELRELLARADVLCMMYPMVEELVAYAPRLRWLHHTQAGVSNIWSSDVWAARDVMITSGRGHVRPTAIAEYCLAAALMFARGLQQGFVDKQAAAMRRTAYRPLRVAGSTIGIVGLGGIGKEVARLCKALGMRVVATRRSATLVEQNIDGADVLLPASEALELARESDFIAVCAALTPETRHLIGAGFLSATRKEPMLVNISRGELIDEAALLRAIADGKVLGAVLDVYEGELDRKPPRAELMKNERILLTPHISGLGAGADTSFMDLFCENLRRYVSGETLINVVDRERGY